MFSHLFLSLVAAVAAASGNPPALDQLQRERPPTYRLEVIRQVDGLPYRAWHLNDRGQVVGYFTNPDGFYTPFLWEQGVMRTLPMPDGVRGAQAYRINSHGQIIGFGQDEKEQEVGLYYDATGAVHDITAHVIPLAINDHGRMAGYVWQGRRSRLRVIDMADGDNGPDFGEPIEFFPVRDALRNTAWPRAINNEGVIIGSFNRSVRGSQPIFLFAAVPQPGGGYRYSEVSLHGVRNVLGFSISDRGYIAAAIPNRGPALIWGIEQEGIGWQLLEPVPLPDGREQDPSMRTGSSALSVNSSGVVVGRESGPGRRRAVAAVWHEGRGYDLLTLVENPEGCNRLLSAVAVNGRGQILCSGIETGNRGAYFLLTPVDGPGL